MLQFAWPASSLTLLSSQNNAVERNRYTKSIYMPPPLRTGARKANPFDDQLAALRQRIALPSTLPTPDEAPRNASNGTSSTTTTASGVNSLLYAGSFTAPAPPPKVPLSSSHQTVDGTTASMLETLRYLKRAAKDRMEEFTDMNEQFCYNAEEEEASFIKKQIATSNGQPIVMHYHDPLQDPFVFDEVDEPHAVVAPSTSSRLSTSPAPAMTTATPLERRDSSQPRGAASRTFEASYDVSSALVTPSSRRSAQQPALGRMDSATGQQNKTPQLHRVLSANQCSRHRLQLSKEQRRTITTPLSLRRRAQ